MAELTGPAGWWRPEALLVEVGANLWTRRGRYCVLTLVVAAMLGSLMWIDMMAARSAIDGRQDFVAAGGTVVIVEREQGGLDASRCGALSHQPYVVAAGGLTQGETVYFDHAPGTPFTSMRVAGDLLPVIDPDARAGTSGGLILPSDAAAELGVGVGSRLGVQGRAWTVAAVVETESRTPTIGRAVLLPEATTGTVGQCWVEFRAGAYDQAASVLPAWFTVEGLSMTPLLERNVSTRDFAAEWVGRPTRHGWILGGVLIAVFALLLVWHRRAELALYVLLGTSRPVVAALQTAELYVAVLAGGLLGMVWASAAATVTGLAGPAPGTHGLRAAVLGVALALVLIPMLAGWLARTNLVAALKERPG